MRHEKIIKDERGTIRIQVKLWIDEWGRTDVHGNSFRYIITAFHKAPRKRVEVLNDTILTPQEILELKIELWNKIKPI